MELSINRLQILDMSDRTCPYPSLERFETIFTLYFREKGLRMQGFGVLLVVWGILDFIMGESGTDVYYDWFGIYLPDAIYDYSHWMSMFLGALLIGAGRKNKA